MEVIWKDFKGKRYLYTDYSYGKNENELLSILDKQIQMIRESDSKVLALTNFTGIQPTAKFMEKIKQAGKNMGNTKIEKTAVLGVTGGALTMMYGSYIDYTKGTHLKTFTNEKAALDWLFSE